MILDDEYLYNSIVERMPYFSLRNIYHDLVEWYDNKEQLREYEHVYERLLLGEFTYDPEDNNIYSTVSIEDMIVGKKSGVYVTNMDECPEFIDYCRLINSHPILHPIYTRTILLNNNMKFNGRYQLRYCRSSNIRYGIRDYNEDDIISIKEIYPDFDLRYIYDRIMLFGIYSNMKKNNVCDFLYSTNKLEINDDMLDEITNIYAFGPNSDNIGKSIIVSTNTYL